MHRHNDAWVLEKEKSKAIVIYTLGMSVSHVHKRPRPEKSVEKGQVGISFIRRRKSQKICPKQPGNSTDNLRALKSGKTFTVVKKGQHDNKVNAKQERRVKR